MKKTVVLFALFLITPLFIIGQKIKNIDYISPFNDSLSAIQKGNSWAFIDTNGKVIIDYRDDLVLTAFGDQNYPVFNSGRCLITKKEKGISYFGYINKKGETVIKPQYLNATNYRNGLAIVLELHKNNLGKNDVLDKNMIDYSYTESAINPSGEIVYYLSDKPTHVTLSKDFVKTPPEIKTKFISKKLIATKNKNNSWTISQVE